LEHTTQRYFLSLLMIYLVVAAGREAPLHGGHVIEELGEHLGG